MSARFFWVTILGLGALTVLTPKDSFIMFFLNGFWGVLGTAAGILFLLAMLTSDDKKKDK